MNQRPKRQSRDIILDSIADGVFTVDEDWRITSFNCTATATSTDFSVTTNIGALGGFSGGIGVGAVAPHPPCP